MMRSFVLVVAVALLASPVAASARSIVVVPGPGTPLQDGIDAAGPGDTVRVKEGIYNEAIVIDKPLRLYGRKAVVDAGCGVLTAVTVAADAVRIRSLTVRGGNFYGIDASVRDLTQIERVTVVPTCVGVDYGINVFQGTRMRIRKNVINDPNGFGDAAIYIGGTNPNADLRIEYNLLTGPNSRGIIVEDSLDFPERPLAVRVRKNTIMGAGVGIFVFGSEHAEITNNVVTGGTAAGIELTANSNANKVTGNKLSGNNPDVLDAGAGNCWKRNTYTTGSVPPCCNGRRR